jgi:hypothetical protein
LFGKVFHFSLLLFITIFQKNKHKKILTFFTLYITLFTFYYYSNKKVITKQNFLIFNFFIPNVLTFFLHQTILTMGDATMHSPTHLPSYIFASNMGPIFPQERGDGWEMGGRMQKSISLSTTISKDV